MKDQRRIAIFDVGGVLCRGVVRPKVRDLARKYALDEKRMMEKARELRPCVDLGSIVEQEFWIRLLASQGVACEPDDLELRSYAVPNPGIPEMFARIPTEEIRLAILSNDSIELFQTRAVALGICDRLDVIVVSAAVGVKKPDPRIYDCVLDALEAPAESCFFVDDKPENVAAGREKGLDAHLFNSVRELESQLGLNGAR